MNNPISKTDSNSIITIDSVAHADTNHQGKIIVCGSHGGKSAVQHLLQFKPAGAIFNDAGKGKNDAGIKGLLVMNEAGIPAATVDTFSAEIGDGKDTYENGIISAVNNQANQYGITVGMQTKEATTLMMQNVEI